MRSNVPLVFVDIETTGLSYEKQVFDVAMVRDNLDGTTEREQFFLAYEEDDSDGFEYDTEAEKYNHIERYSPDLAITEDDAVARIEHMFRDRAHFIGMVPDFDANALWKLIRASDGPRAPFPWYYQLIDVDVMAYGYYTARYRKHMEMARDLGEIRNVQKMYEGLVTLPVDSDAVCRALGVEKPTDEHRHTAMGDAIWTRDIYYALLGQVVPNA